MTNAFTFARVIAASCALLLAACQARDAGQPAPEPLRTTLVVENRAFLDMTIYVIRSSHRQRLGRATGNSTSRFVIPSNLIFGITSLRFQADPIGGGGAPVSHDIQVAQGDEVRLVIPP